MKNYDPLVCDLPDFIKNLQVRLVNNDDYIEFYRFGSGSRYHAGTLIRIHDNTAPRETTAGVEHIYL